MVHQYADWPTYFKVISGHPVRLPKKSQKMTETQCSPKNEKRRKAHPEELLRGEVEAGDTLLLLQLVEGT